MEITLIANGREVVLRGGQIARVGTRPALRIPACVATRDGREAPYSFDPNTNAAITDAALSAWERLRGEISRESVSAIVELPPLKRAAPREWRHEEPERWA